MEGKPEISFAYDSLFADNNEDRLGQLYVESQGINEIKRIFCFFM